MANAREGNTLVFKFRGVLSIALAFFLISISSPPVSANQLTVSSLVELENEKLFLGDVIELQTGICWSSKKPTSKSSKKRLEIFVNSDWVSVGRTKFVSNTQCTGNVRKVFEQIFVWEVDRLGEVDSRRKYLGVLRLRNAASSPSEYAKVTILESREKLREFEASQTVDFVNWLNCQMNGGQWDETRALCISGTKP